MWQQSVMSGYASLTRPTKLTDNNNHRLAILATGSFFAIGLVLLRRVDMRRGIALGLQAAKAR